jgi:hypothetical protein
MDVGEQPQPVFRFYIAQHLQASVDARTPEGVQRSAVGLVERCLEDNVGTQPLVDVYQPGSDGLQELCRLYHARTCDERCFHFLVFSLINTAKVRIFREKTMIFINFLVKMQKKPKKIWKYEHFFLTFASSKPKNRLRLTKKNINFLNSLIKNFTIMKKIFMTLATVAVAATMNAQVYLGGSLGFNFGSETRERAYGNYLYDVKTKTLDFEILPEIGYKISDKMAIGAQIGVKYEKTTDPYYWATGNAVYSYDLTNKSFKFVFKPYFRYTFVEWDKVSLFADAQFGLAFGKDTYEEGIDYTNNILQYTTTDYKSSESSFAIVPGIAYQASEKISIVAKLGNGFGYWYTKSKTPGTLNGIPYDFDRSRSKFGLNLNTLGLTVGVYYNF